MVRPALTATRDESAPTPTRRRVVGLAKLALMVAPLAWVFHKVEWSLVAERAFAFGIFRFLGASVLTASTVTVSGLRWHALLRAHDAHPLPKRRDLVWQSYVALYMNQLPGGVAGDVIRAHRVREAAGGAATSLAVIMFERVCGLVALLALATIGALLLPGSASLAGYIKVSALVTGTIAGIAAVTPWIFAKIRWEATFLGRFPFIASNLARLRPPARLGPMVSALLLSFLIHSISATAVVMFVHAMAPHAAIRGVVAVTPLAMLLTFIPLTPGGFGQREAIFVQLYGLAGVSPNEAVAASLLWFSTSLASIIIGLVLGTIERARAEK